MTDIINFFLIDHLPESAQFLLNGIIGIIFINFVLDIIRYLMYHISKR